MGSKRKSIDQIGRSLVKTVRKGDFVALQRCLGTILHPQDYINRLYGNGRSEKHTILAIACLFDHEDFVCEFLRQYQPDLEVLSLVEGDMLDHERMNLPDFDASPLWVAAANNKLNVVKLLVEHGARVNYVTATNSTALSCACWNGNLDMVRYLVEKGGDIRIAQEQNYTNLLVSVSRGYLEIATYLVDEAGFDVNECDATGITPLCEAVSSRSLKITQFLLARGARNVPSTDECMSAIIFAAETLRTDLFDAILPHCSMLEQIEGIEVYGSALVCLTLNDGIHEQALECFCEALNLRAQHDLPKTLRPMAMKIWGDRHECVTTDQLRAIRFSPDDIWIEAILVRERLLRPRNYGHDRSIRRYSDVLVDRGDYDRVVALWLYRVEVNRYYGTSIDRRILRSVAGTFNRMLLSLSFPSVDALETMIAITLENLDNHSEDFDYHLHTLLLLITIVSFILVKPEVLPADQRKIHRQLHAVNRRKLVTEHDGCSLLHLSLTSHTCTFDDDVDLRYR